MPKYASFEAGAYSLIQVDDGGFVMATISAGNGTDGWLVRTDALGNPLWQRTFDGIGPFGASYVLADAAGFLLVGRACDNDTLPNSSLDQVFRVDASGNLQWNTLVPSTDYPVGAILTNNGSLALADAYGSPSQVLLARVDAFGNPSCAASGPCMGKPVTACDDGAPCTADRCDAAHGGCWHVPLPNAVTCSGTTCSAACP